MISGAKAAKSQTAIPDQGVLARSPGTRACDHQTSEVGMPVLTAGYAFSRVLVQPKLRANRTQAIYRQDADYLARRVTHIPRSARLVADEVKLPLRHDNSPGLQCRLAISQPGDRCEHDADVMADRIVRLLRAGPSPRADLDAARRNGMIASSEHGHRPLASPLPGTMPQVVEAALQSPGQSLEASIRSSIEPFLGLDLSRLRIHHGPVAERSSHALNALAYTVGNHIVFGTGRYLPATADGARLLAHELSHVQQQALSTIGVQRFVRRHYPWLGVVNCGSGTHPVMGADMRTPVAGVQTGDIVTVEGTWFGPGEPGGIVGPMSYLEIETRGDVKVKGYVPHEWIDDPAASEMKRMVDAGTTMKWTPSNARGTQTDFARWATKYPSAAGKLSAPADLVMEPPPTLNCWEAVFLAAYRGHVLSYEDIHHIYQARRGDIAQWETSLISRLKRVGTVLGDLTAPNPGDLVFFEGLDHVAMATGEGVGLNSRIYSFWPPPDQPFTEGGTVDKVKVCTIGSLAKWCEEHGNGETVSITVAEAHWGEAQ